VENLESKIIAIIQNQPGVKARLIASKLGVDKTKLIFSCMESLKVKLFKIKNMAGH